MNPRRLRLNEAELARLPEHEQVAFRAEWEAMESRLKANPLEGFEPHAPQVAFLDARTPIKLLAGGNRAGKTLVGLVDNLVQSLDRKDVPAHLAPYKKWEPPFYCRVMSPDLVDTMEAVLFPKIRDWCPPSALRGGGFDKAYSKVHRMLHFANGSWWQFMSYEQDVSKMGGAALHRVWFDEEPPESVRSENQMRLLDFAGDELFTMTPLYGMSHIYDAVYLRAERVDYITVVTADMDDNPHIDEQTKQRTLAEYSPEERAARKSGRFVSFAGLIYGDSFDTETTVIPEDDVPEHAEVYVGIDPGLQFMCGVVWAYLTPEDDLVVFDELPAQGLTIKEVCQEIHLRNALHRVSPRWYVIDPASRNRNNQTGRSDQMEFADHGVVALPGQNAVMPGISAVKDRLKADKLHVMAHCEELVKEFKRYRWKAPTKQKEAEEDDRRSRPVKKDDHLLDALRYLVMARPLVPEAPPEVDGRSQYERLLQQDLDSSRGGATVTTKLGSIYA